MLIVATSKLIICSPPPHLLSPLPACLPAPKVVLRFPLTCLPLSVLNSGSAVGGAGGAALTHALGVTSDNFKNLWLLVGGEEGVLFKGGGRVRRLNM